MKKLYKKKTNDLINGECFKFKGLSPNYIVVDEIFYKLENINSKKKQLLPFDVWVECWKTF